MVDPRAVLKMLGDKAVAAWWQVSGVARYDDAFETFGSAAAGRLEALAQSGDRVSGEILTELVCQTTQIIWGEFRAFGKDDSTPWLIVRAIDSSWCEVETDAAEVLADIHETFAKVTIAP